MMRLFTKSLLVAGLFLVGLVPAEAMLLGKPVIATGWSGNMGYMDAGNAALVGFRLVPAKDPRDVYADAVWAEPDLADAIAHLRRLADDPVARAMAAGALLRSNADLAVSVTGVAGPGGGTAEKPVGLVHFGAVRAGHEPIAERHVFPGDRDSIRRVSVLTALAMLASLAER